jgi:hypothetical protein
MTGMRQGAIRGTFAERGHDLYETPECATRALIRTGILDGFHKIFEPCAGRGAISRVLKAGGWEVLSHELVGDPDADEDIHGGINFFSAKQLFWADAIVTNPPYRHADKFIRKGLALGAPVIVLLRLMALEGAGRSDLIDEHLNHVFIGKERLPMMHRDGWTGKKLKQGAMPFGWFVFTPESKPHGYFTASRISWREEDKDGLDVDSSAPDRPILIA